MRLYCNCCIQPVFQQCVLFLKVNLTEVALIMSLTWGPWIPLIWEIRWVLFKYDGKNMTAENKGQPVYLMKCHIIEILFGLFCICHCEQQMSHYTLIKKAYSNDYKVCSNSKQHCGHTLCLSGTGNEQF